MSRNLPTRGTGDQDKARSDERIVRAILDLAGRIPPTDRVASDEPAQRARAIAVVAQRKAALAASTLALPPGALGWLTILPELSAIWRIQRQMVADIAGVYGVSAELTRSHMLYCLFRHAAAQALRDFAVQVGARLLIQDIPLRALERAAARIGVSLSQRLAARSLSRWLPVAGAVGVGAYAWYDTAQVARTATALFAGAPPPDTRRARRLKRGEQSAASPETPQADSSSD